MPRSPAQFFRRRVLRCFLVLLVGFPLFPVSGADEPTDHEPIEPVTAPFSMPEMKRPAFPNHAVSIRDFGAVEGGTAKNTEAFAKAIDACANAGGGRVVVPAGKWLTGSIHLRSQIDLHLEEGANVIFSDKSEDYLPAVFVRVGGIEAYNFSPLIYARDCHDIAITGPGHLDGNGEAWWAWKKNDARTLFDMGARGVPVEKRVFGTVEAGIRPSFVGLIGCRNVLLENFTIGSGPNWTVHPIYCENVVIRRVTIDTHGPNNDGIDLDSCRNVLVERCTFKTGDDCLVLKSGYNEDGWRVGKPTENVVMRYCTAREGHGGLVIGSEMSGGVRNVFMHDCQFEGTDRAIRIKSLRGRGGVVENVWAENIQVKDIRREVIVLNMDYGSDRIQPSNGKPPVFQTMRFRNISGGNAPIGILITGLEDSPIRDIRFENIDIDSKKGVVASNVRDLDFENLKVNSPQQPSFALTNASRIKIQKATAARDTSVFLRLEGKESGDVHVESCDIAPSTQPFVLGSGVPADAVSIK